MLSKKLGFENLLVLMFFYVNEITIIGIQKYVCEFKKQNDK